MGNPNPENSSQFFSTLPISVLTKPLNSDFREFNVLEQGPGYFYVQPGFEVGIRISNINDATLIHLVKEIAGVSVVTFLDLSENRKITNKGVSALTSLKNLTRLNLSSCGLNNRGLPYITELKNLEYLDLSYCNRITDEGVRYLQEMTHLIFLDLLGTTKITTAGLKRLRREGLEIHK